METSSRGLRTFPPSGPLSWITTPCTDGMAGAHGQEPWRLFAHGGTGLLRTLGGADLIVAGQGRVGHCCLWGPWTGLCLDSTKSILCPLL